MTYYKNECSNLLDSIVEERFAVSFRLAVVLTVSVVAGVGAVGVLATAGIETLSVAASASVGQTGAVNLGLGGTAGMSTGATAGIGTISPLPAPMLAIYVQAAGACPGLSWTVLAAIGTVESGNGTSTLPGVHSGANSAGAEGPMQFEPATFYEYDYPVPPGGASPPSPYDATDAVYAAARMLCADGATKAGGLAGAIFDYNHASWYVSEVLALSSFYSGEVIPRG